MQFQEMLVPFLSSLAKVTILDLSDGFLPLVLLFPA
jgi:hypothetical protein